MPHSIEHEDTVKLWIGTEDDPADRVTVVITKEDYALLPVKNGRDWDRAPSRCRTRLPGGWSRSGARRADCRGVTARWNLRTR